MNGKVVGDCLSKDSDSISVDKLPRPALNPGNDENVRLREDSFDDCGSLFGNREEQLALEQFLYNRNRF